MSMGWIGLSLIQGAGRPSFHSREGRFRNTAPLFFGDIHAAQFNVRFWGFLSDIDAWLTDVAY